MVVILPCLPKARLRTRETLEYNSKKFVGTAYTRTHHLRIHPYIILYRTVKYNNMIVCKSRAPKKGKIKKKKRGNKNVSCVHFTCVYI